VDAVAAWQGRELPAGRVVPRDNLHVTLAFLGSRPAEELPSIVAALGDAGAAARTPRLTIREYRESRSAGMLVLEDEGGHAAALADDVQARLEQLGVYRREQRPWLPHLTVVRYRQRPRLRPRLPEIDSVVPSDAAVYLSRLRPSGAQYEVVDVVGLGG